MRPFVRSICVRASCVMCVLRNALDRMMVRPTCLRTYARALLRHRGKGRRRPGAGCLLRQVQLSRSLLPHMQWRVHHTRLGTPVCVRVWMCGGVVVTCGRAHRRNRNDGSHPPRLSHHTSQSINQSTDRLTKWPTNSLRPVVKAHRDDWARTNNRLADSDDGLHDLLD